MNFKEYKVYYTNYPMYAPLEDYVKYEGVEEGHFMDYNVKTTIFEVMDATHGTNENVNGFKKYIQIVGLILMYFNVLEDRLLYFYTECGLCFSSKYVELGLKVSNPGIFGIEGIFLDMKNTLNKESTDIVDIIKRLDKFLNICSPRLSDDCNKIRKLRNVVAHGRWKVNPFIEKFYCKVKDQKIKMECMLCIMSLNLIFLKPF